MYATTAFDSRIAVLLTQNVKCEGEGRDCMEVLRHPGGWMDTHGLAQEIGIQAFISLPHICLVCTLDLVFSLSFLHILFFLYFS